MSTKKKAVLQALGIETWRERSASEAVVPATAVVEVKPARVAAAAAPPMPAAAEQARTTAPAPAATKPSRIITKSDDRIVPADWDALKAMVSGCQHCKLCSTRTNTVFGVGNRHAPLMVVGEGPGADEDALGEPFVGRAGKLLDEMLKSIGRSRVDGPSNPLSNSVFIANVVKCRPPGNRDPEPDEVEGCRPYLDMQIELVKPKLIVALGRIAAQRLLSTDQPLSRLRGPLHHYGKSNTPVFVTYHPAYLLRSPREKAKSWEDLKQVWQHLHTAG